MHNDSGRQKGLLDGMLLETFEELTHSRQVEFTKQIGTDPDTVLRDVIAMRDAW